MTRAQRIAVRVFWQRVHRKIIWFVPAAIPLDLNVRLGEIIVSHRQEPPRKATRAEVRRIADQFSWPEEG